ncbi:MAG: DNA recombination protein RmuC [Bacteroidaceae bacterium]|nr:DNA recombination protein RmuC [Bacteroidaceae bacterium]
MTLTIIAAVLAAAVGLLAGMLISNKEKVRLREERQAAETQAATTQAQWEAKVEGLTTLLDTTRQDHMRSSSASTADFEARLEAQKNEAAQSLQAAKDEAAQHLQTAKDEADRRLAEYKEEVLKRHNTVVDELKQSHQRLLDEQERRHRSDTEALEKRFADTIRALREQVENTTNTMLKQRQEEFSDSSTRNIDSIVKPLKETIDKMKEEMARNSTVQSNMSAEIKTNMEHMIRQSIEAQKSAEELTRAFKHESKTQGDWGEVVLSNLLEKQGFTEGKDFEVQAAMRDDDGNTIRPDEGESMRPDVLLHLDDKRDVIIDSKVSMTAFIDYANATDDLSQRIHLKEHIASLKKHVDELSAKNYTQYQTRPHLDFVIMFVPHSPALWVATKEEPSLWQDAMQKKVFIADEQTLYAALRIIRITWTHIDQEQNHRRIYELAQEMIERTGNFLKEYDSVGKNLRDAVEAFESSRKKLLPGGRSIGTTASQILALGIDNVRVNKGKRGTAIIPKDYVDNTLNLGDSDDSPTPTEI